MKRVALMAGAALGAAAFAFPTIGFARTHSPQGQAIRCAALHTQYDKLHALETGASANALPVIQALEANAKAKYNGEGCTPAIP